MARATLNRFLLSVLMQKSICLSIRAQCLTATFRFFPKCHKVSAYVIIMYVATDKKFLCFRFPDIASIQLKMPNIHFIPVNISNKDGQIVKVLILFPEKLVRVGRTQYKFLIDFINVHIFL